MDLEKQEICGLYFETNACDDEVEHIHCYCNKADGTWDSPDVKSSSASNSVFEADCNLFL